MKTPDKDIVVSITSGTIIKGIAIFFGVWLLWLLNNLLLLVITSIIFASAIEPGIKFLGKYRIHRIPSVLLMYLGLAGMFFGLIFAFVPPIVNETSDIMQKLPGIMRSIDQNIFGGNNLLTPVAIEVEQSQATTGSAVAPIFSELFNKVSSVNDAHSGVLDTASVIFGGIFSFVLVVVLSFYFAMQERGIENFLKIVIPFGRESYAINLWERSRAKIGKWMQGQLLLGVLIFVLVYLGLTIFGIPYAMSLALLAGVLELIPVFGPIIAAIPGVVLAFMTGGASLAFIIASFYLLVQQFESHLIYPLVVRKVVGVPPILVILALVIGGQLAGFVGMLISIPVAAAIMEIVEDIERKKGIHA